MLFSTQHGLQLSELGQDELELGHEEVDELLGHDDELDDFLHVQLEDDDELDEHPQLELELDEGQDELELEEQAPKVLEELELGHDDDELMEHAQSFLPHFPLFPLYLLSME
jgi:hypothetical protein